MNDVKIEGIVGISHIALTVPDIEAAWKQFQMLGYEERSEGIIEEHDYGIKAKVIFNGPVTIELLSPLGDPETSPYADQLKQNRYCMDHICYDVSDLDAALQQLKKKRFMALSQPRTTVVWNRRAVLLGNRKMGVIEIMEAE